MLIFHCHVSFRGCKWYLKAGQIGVCELREGDFLPWWKKFVHQKSGVLPYFFMDFYTSQVFTPPKTNSLPLKKWWLENYFPFEMDMLIFRGNKPHIFHHPPFSNSAWSFWRKTWFLSQQGTDLGGGQLLEEVITPVNPIQKVTLLKIGPFKAPQGSHFLIFQLPWFFWDLKVAPHNSTFLLVRSPSCRCCNQWPHQAFVLGCQEAHVPKLPSRAVSVGPRFHSSAVNPRQEPPKCHLEKKNKIFNGWSEGGFAAATWNSRWLVGKGEELLAHRKGR